MLRKNSPQCSKPPFRGRQRPCDAYHCPKHGYYVRLRRALRILRLLPATREAYTCPVHLNKRMSPAAVGKVAEAIRRRALRLFPGAICLVFVHVTHSSALGLYPVPHLHVLVCAPQGTMRLEMMGRIAARTRSLSQAHVLAWQKVRSLRATVLYLCQATRAHRRMPEDQLPRRGDRYQQVYGARGLAPKRKSAQIAQS